MHFGIRSPGRFLLSCNVLSMHGSLLGRHSVASTVWRGYISFGLISIPVRLFRAARAERISLRRLYRKPSSGGDVSDSEDDESDAGPGSTLSDGAESGRTKAASARLEQFYPSPEPFRGGPAEVRMAAEPTLAPLQQVAVKKGSSDVVSPSSVVKGYEYEKNRYVALEAEELKSAIPKTSASMEIEEFVELAAIDPVYFETSYYVSPEAAGEKAYALLYRSMQLSGLVAIAQFAMHSREHVVVVRAGKTGLLAHTMFFASEVRADEEYRANVAEVGKKELELAQSLIHSLTSPFEPEKYRDTYREKIQALIDSKVKGQPLPEAPAITRQAEVVDIADALRRSLANLKKPVASSRESAPAEPAKSGAKPARSKRAGRSS